MAHPALPPSGADALVLGLGRDGIDQLVRTARRRCVPLPPDEEPRDPSRPSGASGPVSSSWCAKCVARTMCARHVAYANVSCSSSGEASPFHGSRNASRRRRVTAGGRSPAASRRGAATSRTATRTGPRARVAPVDEARPARTDEDVAAVHVAVVDRVCERRGAQLVAHRRGRASCRIDRTALVDEERRLVAPQLTGEKPVEELPEDTQTRVGRAGRGPSVDRRARCTLHLRVTRRICSKIVACPAGSTESHIGIPSSDMSTRPRSMSAASASRRTTGHRPAMSAMITARDGPPALPP